MVGHEGYAPSTSLCKSDVITTSPVTHCLVVGRRGYAPLTSPCQSDVILVHQRPIILAEAEGIEPPPRLLESLVLPLHHASVNIYKLAPPRGNDPLLLG